MASSPKPRWAQDYGMGTERTKRVAQGKERSMKRSKLLGSPLPTPGSPLDNAVKKDRQRKMVPNPLSSPHHHHESARVEKMSSPLPEIRTDPTNGMFHGPGLRDSAWHLWDRSEGRSAHRVLYRTFYNTKWGLAVELDVTSFGSFRFAISDFARPVLVTRSGIQREVAAFGAPRLLHELKTRSRVGEVRMGAAREHFGEWVAEVVGMTILIAQANLHNPSGRLQLLLHPDGFIFVGETMSICSIPSSFVVEGGKLTSPCTVEEGRERIGREMSVHKTPGWQKMVQGKKNAGTQKALYYSEEEEATEQVRRAKLEEDSDVHKGDWMGGLRRALRERTAMQKADEEAATAFLKMPANIRLEAVIHVETEKVKRDRKQGTISEEEYNERMAMIQDRATFPARALRADEALHFSMFCDKRSKTHRSVAEFGGWDKLGWEAKLDVACMILQQQEREGASRVAWLRSNLRKGSSYFETIQREVEGDKPVLDPEEQREVHRDPQRTELMAGKTINGFTKWHTEDLDNQTKAWKARKGREVRQLYEECDACGRPCEVKGKGICNRCLEHEKEREETGAKTLTIDPETFYGDSRALLKHPGFSEYKGPPLQSDLKIRNKIEPRLLQSSTGERRGYWNKFGDLEPRPMRTEEDKLQDKQRTEEDHKKARLQTRRLMKLDGEDEITQEEKSDFISLVRNDHFDAVKLLLLRDIAVFSTEPIMEQRDEHGNTAIIIAAQQGLQKMSKLLVAANCNLNAQNKKGDTALHYAALYGFHSLMDYYKRKGADDTMTNHAGKTCYQLEATIFK